MARLFPSMQTALLLRQPELLPVSGRAGAGRRQRGGRDEGIGGLTCHERDKLLIARLARRDSSALAELIEQHQRRVRLLAVRLMRWDPHEADDVTQDVFLAAWRHAARFRGDASLSTWLLRITVNACRSRRRRRLLGVRWLRSRRDVGEPEVAAADGDASRDETAAEVRRAVARLGAAEREVVVMYYLEQLPARQIAATLNISVAAVDVRLYRARKKLHAMLADKIEDVFS